MLVKSTDGAHQIVIYELGIMKYQGHNGYDQAMVADITNGDVIIDLEGDKRDIEPFFDKKKQQAHSE